MVRNSVLIIDFIQLRQREGADLKQAVIEADGSEDPVPGAGGGSRRPPVESIAGFRGFC